MESLSDHRTSFLAKLREKMTIMNINIHEAKPFDLDSYRSDAISPRRGRDAPYAISGRPTGGALGVGRLRGRGWRRPRLRRLRDEREGPEERREMGRLPCQRGEHCFLLQLLRSTTGSSDPKNWSLIGRNR
uniref:Uncharacterized protein n=1 Tax=Molossus molossus TaxID=27622 RepID=A0A7J8C902_MOLMO|nr:hypothetical protein HJG59_009955 [Molossus molossus]